LYTPSQEVLETSGVIGLRSPLTKDTRGMMKQRIVALRRLAAAPSGDVQ